MRKFRVGVASLMLGALVQMCHVGSTLADESRAYVAFAAGKYKTALDLAQKEAEAGSKEAYTLIGEMYSGGLGVSRDYAKAANAYAKAADLGDANAAFSLALLTAKGLGVRKDLAHGSQSVRTGRQRGKPGRPIQSRSNVPARARTSGQRSQGRRVDDESGREWQYAGAVRSRGLLSVWTRSPA